SKHNFVKIEGQKNENNTPFGGCAIKEI
ncbi:MAG: hypothetical protein RIR48_35, partial [Bacteroidota bacterium]